jgi:hypothetical protein
MGPWDSEPRITVLARVSSNLAVSQSVKLDSCRHELVLRQSPAGKEVNTGSRGVSIVLSCYQATTIEQTKDFMRATVLICRVLGSVKLL